MQSMTIQSENLFKFEEDDSKRKILRSWQLSPEGKSEEIRESLLRLGIHANEKDAVHCVYFSNSGPESRQFEGIIQVNLQRGTICFKQPKASLLSCCLGSQQKSASSTTLIDIHSLCGFLFGSQSSIFRGLGRKDLRLRKDCDQWKYLSIVDTNGDTYDFQFGKRNDAIDFVVAVSSVASTLKIKFAGVTNKSLLRILMFREKLRKIAKLRKSSIAGLLGSAVYKTVT